MSHRRAKKLRQAIRRGETCKTPERPGPNFTDLPDNRADRRLKKFRKREHERQLKESSPALNRRHRSRWVAVFFWLTMPDYRSALENPHKKASNRAKTCKKKVEAAA